MTSTFIPGYLGTVTLNTDDITAIGSVVKLGQTRAVMSKPTFGNPWGNVLGGQRLGSFSANGPIAAEQISDLQDAFDANTPIAFELQIGEASGATDAGIYSGDCVIGSFTIDASADGEWDWSIDAQTSGTVTYTPVVVGS